MAGDLRADFDRFRIDFAMLAGLLCLVVYSIGCTNGKMPVPDPQQRLRNAEEIAADSGLTRMEPEATSANALPIAAWVRRTPNTSPEKNSLHIYIEGDGLAWRSRRRVSRDPTPAEPIGLKLAAADPSSATIIYLGRPCQYGFTAESACRPIFWTAARHGETVIDAMNRRIDAIIAKLGDQTSLYLVGYSGGGVVAALLAARRDDVRGFVTIAAPLDVGGWTRSARVSPLAASLSPMDSIEPLRSLRQHHFVGRDDSRVPIAATEAFHRALGPEAMSRLTIVEDMDHRSWPSHWKTLVEANDLFD